ncbi:MAG: TolC family outer membrane protein [Rhodanobacter sp.]
MRLKLLPLLLCLGLAPLPGHAEDLMDAYRQAIANDPVLSTADATRLVVAENVPQARSALLPQLSVGLGLQQIHGNEGSFVDANGNSVSTGAAGHTRERDLSGTLNQSIINLASIASLRAAQSGRDAGDQTYRAALQNLYIRVCAAYFNVLISEDNMDVFKSYEDAYKQEFNQSSVRHQNGLATASDVSQSQAYYLYIKSQRISAQDSLKDARRALEQITGKPTTGTLKKLREDVPVEAPSPADSKAWVAAAMQSNPVILAAHDTVDADEHRVSAARAGHLPTLTGSLQYGKVGTWSSAVPGAAPSSAAYGPGVTTIGLTLNVPIFSGGLTQSQVRQAIAQRDADEGTLESQRRQAARDADNYYNLVVDGIEQVDAARTSVEAARKSLTSMKAGYEIGTQSLTNVVFAIEQLANVQSEYIVVRHQLVLNKLLLKQAAGSVDVHDLEDVNKLLE